MKKLLRQFLLAACVLSAPLIVLLLDLPADVFAGCGGYGYSCQQPVCFGLEVTTDSGSTWKDGSVTIYGAPGTQVSLPCEQSSRLVQGIVYRAGLSVSGRTLLPS